MISILHLVAYFAALLGFIFVILSLACGLYYLAELVEEYSVYTKKVIKSITYAVITLHVLLWIVDRLPFLYLAFSVFCHLVYSLNLKTFPFIKLTSIPFISGCILVFVDHFLWFNYFTTHYRPFMDIAAFFGLCVWLVPFAYFISLSANDNALPMSTDPAYAADNASHQQKQGLMKSLLNTAGFKLNETSSSAPPSDFSNTVYSNSPSTSFSQPPSNIGLASGVHFTTNVDRDIQNRKAL